MLYDALTDLIKNTMQALYFHEGFFHARIILLRNFATDKKLLINTLSSEKKSIEFNTPSPADFVNLILLTLYQFILLQVRFNAG